MLPGLSQDNVQATSVGRGHVLHEAADTEEDERARPRVLQRWLLSRHAATASWE